MIRTRSSGGVFADAPATNVPASAPKIDLIFVFKVFVVPVPFNSSPESWSPRRGAHENGKVQDLESESVAALRESVYETLV
jgi:hypothetical protein